MAKYFGVGEAIPLAGKGTAIIRERLGEGGQGVVYRVTVQGRDYALKWYHRSAVADPARFYRNLENNVKNGAPTDAFLWPLFLTTRVSDSFGYVMPLRPKNYKQLSDFLLAKARFASLSAAANAALAIVNAFRELHRRGYSYQDLNDGNFFIDPATGDVLICDNDNVAPFGESLGIAGKARYMAPEVVRNLKRPDVMTDRFSLSVILFRLLFLDHPLEGRRVAEAPCLTEGLELKFYGTDPVFIFDRDDDSNRPVRGIHANAIRFWPLYPKFVREAFLTAFSKDAMSGKAPRPTDNDWQILFTNLRSVIVACPCGGETFLDTGGDSLCVNCGLKIPRPPVFTSQGKYKVPLFPGVKLYRCHTDGESDDYNEITGEVIRNPKNPAVWGLKNRSGFTWTVEERDGAITQIANGEVAVVLKIKAINFSNTKAIVEG